MMFPGSILPGNTMTALSILDLAPIPQGSTAGDALHNARSLAQHAERLGDRRYWLAMPVMLWCSASQ